MAALEQEIAAPPEEQQAAPPQQGDPIETYYNYLKKAGADVAPNLDSFKKTLSDDKTAQQYYGYLKDHHFDAPPTYGSFAKTLGIAQAPPEHQLTHTPVQDIRHLKEMSEKPVESRTTVLDPMSGSSTTEWDQGDVARNKQFSDQYEVGVNNLATQWGTDPKATKQALNDFPEQSDEGMLKRNAELYKNNPVMYSRYKDANDIRTAIASSGPDGPLDAHLFNEAQTSSNYEDLQHHIAIQQEIISKHGLGQEYMEKLKNTQAPLINTLDPGLHLQYWNSEDHKFGLSEFQYAGLETFKMFQPARFQEVMNILRENRGLEQGGEPKPEGQGKKGYEYDRGVENVLYQLEQQGRQNTGRYIDQQNVEVGKNISSLKDQYQARINAATDPVEQNRLVEEFKTHPLIQEANKLDEGKEALQYSQSEDERRFPLNYSDQATRLAKDAMDSTSGVMGDTGSWFKNVALNAGESGDNTMRFIKNTFINMLGSEQMQAAQHAKDIGHQALTELSTYRPTSYTGTQSPLLVSDDLKLKVQNAFDEKGLSDQQREQKAISLVRENPDQIRVNPQAGQQNLTGKSVLFMAGNTLGQILGIADQSLLMGGLFGSAGKAQQMANAIIPMYTSTQNQLYEQALARGDEKPLLKSSLDAAIISLASMINPDVKIIKGMVGAETGIGKMIAGVDEATWNKVLTENKPLVDQMIAGTKATAKQLGLANLQYGLIVPTAQYLVHKNVFNENPNLGDMIKDGIIQTNITMALPALAHGIWGFKNATEVNPASKYAIVEAGLHHQENIDLINSQVERGQITPDKAEKIKEVIKQTGQILKDTEMTKTDGTPMNEKEVSDVVYNQLRKKVLEGKLKNAADPQKPIIEDRIHDINQQISELHTSDADKQKTELNKMLTDNMDKIKDKMPAFESAIKDAVKRNEPEEVFKMIYDQATETKNVDGKEISSRSATEEMFGKEMVQKAIDLHNNKIKTNESKTEANAQTEKVAEKPPEGAETNQPVSGAAPSISEPKTQEHGTLQIVEPGGMGTHSGGGESIGGSAEGSGMGSSDTGKIPPGEGQQAQTENPGQEKTTGIKKSISEPTRAEHLLPPVELKSIGSDKDVLIAGKKAVDEGLIKPREVAARVIAENGIYSPDEGGAMQYYSHQLRAAEDTYRADKQEAVKALAKNPNDTEAFYNKFDADQKLAQLDDEIDAKTKADRINSRSWGNLGNIMQIETDESFSPSRVRSVIKENYGGEMPAKVKEKLETAIAERDKAISDLKAAKDKIALQQLEKDAAKEKPTKEKKTVAERKADLKEERIKLVEDLKKALKKDAGNLGANPLPINTIEAVSKLALNYFKDGVVTLEGLTNKVYNDLKDVVDGLDKGSVRDAISNYQPLRTETRKNETDRVGRKADNLNEKLASGNIEPVKRTPILNFEKDTDYIKAKQRLLNAEYKIKQEKFKSYMSKESGLQKTAGWINRLARLSILSGVKVLEKLSAAATIGSAAMKVPEEVMNGIWGQTFPKIKEKADTDMGMNAMSVGKYYSQFFNPVEFVKDTKDIIKSGETRLGKELEKTHYDHIPLLDLPTDLHQVIKGPPKRAMFQYALTKIIDAEQKKGVDINHPLVLESARQRAFARAKYEIFMEDNSLSRMFGKWDAKWKDQGTAGTAKSFLLHFILPVSKVPTNIVRRVGLSVGGLPIGLTKAALAYKNGVENLSTDEANAIGKALTKGTLGTALWMVGFFGYKSMGGLYSKYDPDKKKGPDEPLTDDMKLANQQISKPWQHALPFEVMQLGSTFRHIYEMSKEKDGDPIAIAKATIGSTGTIVEQIPAVSTPINLIEATKDPYMGKKAVDDLKRRFEPQLLKDLNVIKPEEKQATGGRPGRGSRR